MSSGAKKRGQLHDVHRREILPSMRCDCLRWRRLAVGWFFQELRLKNCVWAWVRRKSWRARGKTDTGWPPDKKPNGTKTVDAGTHWQQSLETCDIRRLKSKPRQTQTLLLQSQPMPSATWLPCKPVHFLSFYCGSIHYMRQTGVINLQASSLIVNTIEYRSFRK